MVLYVAMAFWAAIGWAFNARLASMLARAIAPTGALFTFLALWTGAFWGKPAWGTWWVWDARLTSELILLFLYAGFSPSSRPSTSRAAPTAPARWWRSSAASTCPSSTSR